MAEGHREWDGSQGQEETLTVVTRVDGPPGEGHGAPETIGHEPVGLTPPAEALAPVTTQRRQQYRHAEGVPFRRGRGKRDLCFGPKGPPRCVADDSGSRNLTSQSYTHHPPRNRIPLTSLVLPNDLPPLLPPFPGPSHPSSSPTPPSADRDPLQPRFLTPPTPNLRTTLLG